MTASFSARSLSKPNTGFNFNKKKKFKATGNNMKIRFITSAVELLMNVSKQHSGKLC